MPRNSKQGYDSFAQKERSQVRTNQITHALEVIFNDDEVNYQKFGRDFNRELNTRVGALIRFFEGDSREWNFFLPDIRAVLTEIANPDMASGAQDDIRKLLTKKQKQELIAWLRSRTDQVR